jgi:hypothetical protein
MSDTPRTDAVTEHYYSAGGLRSAAVVRADFARQLERDLAQRTAERDEARRDLCVSEAIDRLQEANPNALISYSESRRVSREIATERGWNCYDLIDEKEAKP